VKKLPIGVNDFEKLVSKGYYFVDKSMLIKDVLDFPGEIKLITRPRRFGKTLNMSMLDHFFSLFRKGDFFEEFAIWNEKKLVKDHYHKYPVIFVSFKEVKEVDWEKGISKMKRVLANLAKEYREMAKDPVDRKYITSIAMKEGDEGDFSDLLRYLTGLLHKETGKKVILLVDEYDVPIEAAYTYRNNDSKYYDNMVAFMRNMLTAALKDNEHLEFGILTGVYRVAKESIFSGLNNLAVYTVFENRMVNRFGFTEEETVEILCHYGLDSKEDIETVREWYGGFRVGDYEPLYNPWSVIYYVAERLSGRLPRASVQPFWINTSSNDIIKEQVEKNLEMREHLHSLLEGKEIKRKVDPWLSLRELEEVRHGVWTLFVSGGYLTARYLIGDMYALKVPNREVLKFFKEVVSGWLERSVKFPASNLYSALIDMLVEGKTGDFAHYLEEFVKNTLSYFDIGGDEPEKVYKAFLLGMLAITMNGYMVESEVESGYGRLDVVVYPKEKRYGSYAAIFEVKRARNEKELEEFAKQALNQIKDRQYYAKMKNLGLKIIGFGVAFSGKKAVVKVEVIN